MISGYPAMVRKHNVLLNTINHPTVMPMIQNIWYLGDCWFIIDTWRAQGNVSNIVSDGLRMIICCFVTCEVEIRLW